MPDKLRDEWLSDKELTPNQKLKIEELLRLFFPDHFLGGRYRFAVKQSDPHRLLIWNGTELIGHLLAVGRNVKLDGEHLKLLFVGELCVSREYQGKGIGKLLMQSLDPHLDKKFDLVLLCCRPDLLGFYQKVGWKLLDMKVFFGPDETRSRCAEGIVVGKILTPKANSTLFKGASLYLGEAF